MLRDRHDSSVHVQGRTANDTLPATMLHAGSNMQAFFPTATTQLEVGLCQHPVKPASCSKVLYCADHTSKHNSKFNQKRCISLELTRTPRRCASGPPGWAPCPPGRQPAPAGGAVRFRLPGHPAMRHPALLPACGGTESFVQDDDLHAFETVSVILCWCWCCCCMQCLSAHIGHGA